MQIANCEVRLLGDIANSVPKLNITPAEAAILRAIHGPDSVVRVNAVGMDKRSHKEEYDRLAALYGGSGDTDGTKIFFKLFPRTFDPRLPVTFKDVGIETVSEVEAPTPDIPDESDEDFSKVAPMNVEAESSLESEAESVEETSEEVSPRRGRKPKML